MYVVVYFKEGEVVAVVPPDATPNEGEFDNWESGEGDTITEAKADALDALDTVARA